MRYFQYTKNIWVSREMNIRRRIIIYYYNIKFNNPNRVRMNVRKNNRSEGPIILSIRRNILFIVKGILHIGADLIHFIRRNLLFIVKKILHIGADLILRTFVGRDIILISELQKGIHNIDIKGVDFLNINNLEDIVSRKKVIREKEKTIVFVPPHVGDNEKGEEHEYEVPDLYCGEIENALIVGETNIIVSNRTLLTDVTPGLLKRVDLSYGDLLINTDKYAIIYKKNQTYIDEKAICLIKAGNYNYYHYMVETLSRLVLIDEVEEYRSLPLLVDSVVKDNKNFIELMNKCNIYNHPIIWIEKNIHYKIRELVYASCAVFMPGNLRDRYSIVESDFIVSGWLLKKLQDRLKYNLNVAKGYKQIIISRSDIANSRLQNESEVVHILNECGYEAVYPEKMTIEEQAGIFGASNRIVATSGGAMANIIFCQPETEVFCIIPDKHKFYLYSSMAYLLNIKYHVIDAEIKKLTAYPGLDEFVVKIDRVKLVGGLKNDK